MEGMWPRPLSDASSSYRDSGYQSVEPLALTTAADFDKAYSTVHAAFRAGVTRDAEWRRRQLRRTWWMIEENKERICAALHRDLHKHRQESLLGDCVAVQLEIMHVLDSLDEWMRDEKPSRGSASVVNTLGGAMVRKEPLGVTLIIGTWSHPVVLLLQPMVAAIAAGCAMILKPSDAAPATQDLLAELVPQFLDPGAIRLVTGGPWEMQQILARRFDHIFFTGSAATARIVHAAAAKFLTPVTLELGGRNPAIVTDSANLDQTAKHIATDKFCNAGQSCTGVNHILVDPKLRDALVVKLTHYFNAFGKFDTAVQPDYYAHIINERHFRRLDKLLQKTSGTIAYGGQRDRSALYFAPTILIDVAPDDPLLKEEIFGPILPIVDADLDTALQLARGDGTSPADDAPLAIYAFTNDPAQKLRVLNETRSGGVTFNDCGLHAAAEDAPFGGLGASGHGSYHGRYGFLAFSHLRTYIDALPGWMEKALEARYPPYSDEKTAQLAPGVRPPFDREGNELGAPKGILKGFFGKGKA